MKHNFSAWIAPHCQTDNKLWQHVAVMLLKGMKDVHVILWPDLWSWIAICPSPDYAPTHPYLQICLIPERLSECLFHILVEWFLEIVAKHPEGSTALTLAGCSIHMSLRRQVISSTICGSVDTSMGSQLGCGGSKLIGCCCLLGSLWDWLRGFNGTN